MHVPFPAAVIVKVPVHRFLARKSRISNEARTQTSAFYHHSPPCLNLHLYISIVFFLHHHISMFSLLFLLNFIVAPLLLLISIVYPPIIPDLINQKTDNR